MLMYSDQKSLVTSAATMIVLVDVDESEGKCTDVYSILNASATFSKKNSIFTSDS